MSFFSSIIDFPFAQFKKQSNLQSYFQTFWQSCHPPSLLLLPNRFKKSCSTLNYLRFWLRYSTLVQFVSFQFSFLVLFAKTFLLCCFFICPLFSLCHVFRLTVRLILQTTLLHTVFFIVLQLHLQLCAEFFGFASRLWLRRMWHKHLRGSSSSSIISSRTLSSLGPQG